MESGQVKRRVCIIGAGGAGLAAIRHVSSIPNFEGVVFEQSSQIGGLWVYSDATGPTTFSNPLYRSLRTNLPKEIMGFLDFPFLNNGRGTCAAGAAGENSEHQSTSYIHHSQVLRYLEDYAEHFHLKDYIHFNKRVIGVKPIFPSSSSTQTTGGISKDVEQESNTKWHVLVHSTCSTSTTPTTTTTTTTLHSNSAHSSAAAAAAEKVEKVEEYFFDSVMVCNGHFVKPIIPDIVNIKEFKGEVLHSQDYRVPDVYVGKRVVVVGAGPSGIDISLEIAQVATEVILSQRKPPLNWGSFPTNIRQTFPIKSATKDGFIFENDESVADVQTLIYCSGYAYDFPFLGAECGVRVKRQGTRVTPLYRHMIHTHFPSLCFIGLPFRICPFILFDCQVRHYVKYLRGLIRLPTEEEMNAERRKDKSLRKMMGLPFKSSHQLDSAQWQYFETLAEEADFELVGPTAPPSNFSVVRQIFEGVVQRRLLLGPNYRNDVVHIIDEGRRTDFVHN